MRKKILVAEKSDAIRSIAESILHQNGFDVVSASDINKAKELMIAVEPNMYVIGADLKGDDGKYLYELLEENPRAASTPLLLISDPDGRSLPYPDEVIMARPFDPKDFLDRVRLFVGAGDAVSSEKVESVEPLSSSDSVNDDFLDSALGIDRIEVEESEEMDKTHISQKIRQIMAEKKKKDIYDIHQEVGDMKDKIDESSSRVESLMITDDTDIKAKSDKPSEQHPKNKIQSKSNLDIASDQYGLIEQDVNEDLMTEALAEKAKKDHDYDWFINEMQKEGKPPKDAAKGPTNNSGGIQTKPSSDAIDPIQSTPPKEDFQPGTGVASEPEIKPGGVDQFISEFKKEIKKMSDDSEKSPVTKQVKAEPPQQIAVKETAEVSKEAVQPALDPAEIHHFVSHMVEMLAEKVAKRIVDKIDKDELYQMLRDHIPQMASKKK